VGTVLRLFRFRPAVAGFDAELRDVLMPDIRRLPGNLGAFAGRSGPDDDGERLVASAWASQEAMAAGVGESFDAPVFHPELLDGSTDRRLDILPIVFSLPPDRAVEAGILRLVFGRTLPGDLDAYLAAVQAGALADRAAGIGPVALYLSALAPDAFATLSVWASWADLETATGADIHETARTRHEALLDRWTADHFEAVPGTL
jgi:heme-degrading monooxygenase HmoA